MNGLFPWKINRVLHLLILFKNTRTFLKSEYCLQTKKNFSEIMVKKNTIEMHSMQNDGEFVVAERFIRILKNKIYKYTISTS